MRSGFTSSRSLLGLLLLLCATGVSTSRAAPPAAQNSANANLGLPAALAGMDQAALRFASMTADLEYTKVTLVVDDHSTERGKIFFEKSKGKLRVMLAFSSPAEKYVLFQDGKVSIYRPKIAEVEEYTLANNQGLMEQFLLLGFGTSGADLQKSYDVSWKGEETLDGERTVHLELAPKSEQVAARLARVELWLSPETWQPLQQRFTEPSKDYLTARYRNVRQNAKIAAGNFQFPIRGKVRTVRPQSGN